MNWLKQNLDLAGLILKWLTISAIVLSGVFGLIKFANALTINAYQTAELIEKVDKLEKSVTNCQLMYADMIRMLKDHLEKN